MKILRYFNVMVDDLKVFPPNVINFKNMKEEVRQYKLAEPVYEIQNSVIAEYNELITDYLLARNDVIYTELIKDFASFIAVFEEVRKFALNNTKQEKAVLVYYQELYQDFDHKKDWYEFVLDSIKELHVQLTDEFEDELVGTSQWKKLFWDTHKEKRNYFRKEVLKV